MSNYTINEAIFFGFLSKYIWINDIYLASVCKAETEVQNAVWQTASKCMLQVHLVTFDEQIRIFDTPVQ